MRTRGAILLISCYELGHQPFHLASLGAMLKQGGYAPVYADTAVATLSDETIRQASFVAISVPMHTALRLGEQLAQRIRSLNPAAHICMYGLYALLNADHLLQHTIDSAIGGEYEVPLLKLVQAIEQGEQLTIPGVRTRLVESGPWIQRTPFIVPERRSLPPLPRYARLQWGDEWRVVGYTESTRGCKHTCLHCPVTPIYNGRFFAVPLEIVLATIKIEHLLKQRHLLQELRECGCIFVVSAVESLNNTVLERLDKGHISADVAEAFALMEQAGISLRPSLLPFSPWETLDSYIDLLNFFEQQHFIEHIDPVHLSIRLLVPPGSALLDGQDTATWLGELDATAYTYRWRHPDPRMDMLHQQVATLAEQANTCEADPIETFFGVKALALAATGQAFSVERAMQDYGQRKVLPHLSESWFCCAEPTSAQLVPQLKKPTV